MPHQSDMNDRQILDCPNCPNQGWYVNSQGDQEQCQFCYCEPGSRFNYEASMRSDMNERKDMSTNQNRGDAALLPCPFCGNEAPEIRSNGIGDFYVICSGDEEGELHCEASTSDRSCESEQKAIRRWNTRAESALQLRVTSLEAILRRIIKSTPHSMCWDAEAWAMAEATLSPSGPQEA